MSEERERERAAPRAGEPYSGPVPPPRSVLWGTLVKRYRWGLSGRAMCIVVAFLLVTAVGGIRGLYPFLAVTSTTGADIIVVDGWMPTYLIRDIAARAKMTDCRYVLVARQVRPDLNDVESGRFVAEYIATAFAEEGVSRERIHIVAFDAVQTDRTYASACAVRTWLESECPSARALDVATLGPHARRTRKLYQDAFRGTLSIGVIAVPPEDYDPKRWWRFSQGVREVPFELLAYLYAQFFFRPETAAP